MSETMVEKVARAIYERYERCEPFHSLWDCAGFNKEYWRDIARAAIEAMREPTVGMYKAFDAEKDTGAPFNNGYRAMISAALHDPEGGEGEKK